jgi:carbamoylphosphate synthase small subunit
MVANDPFDESAWKSKQLIANCCEKSQIPQIPKIIRSFMTRKLRQIGERFLGIFRRDLAHQGTVWRVKYCAITPINCPANRAGNANCFYTSHETRK